VLQQKENRSSNREKHLRKKENAGYLKMLVRDKTPEFQDKFSAYLDVQISLQIVVNITVK
jgi:hypothetical protein